MACTELEQPGPTDELARLAHELTRRDRLAAAALRAAPARRLAVVRAGRDFVRLRVDHARGGDVARLAGYIAPRVGVLRAVASPATDSVRVTINPSRTSVQAVVDAARGSSAADWPASDAPTAASGAGSRLLFATAVLSGVASGSLGPVAETAAVALTALPCLGRAVRAMREGRLSVDALDVAAVVTALASSRVNTAALMTWLLGIGDLVLERSVRRARSAIAPLLCLEMDAWRRNGGGQVERVAAHDLAVGDRVIIYAGERVPADGLVAAGVGVVDQRALTGESRPYDRRAGEHVLAATVLVDGQLEIVVERAGAATAAARLVSIVQHAGSKPMALQREAERAAERLVVPTLALGVLAAAVTGQVDRLTSVLITDFGTGIRIAVPTIALVSQTLAAREGILMKGGQHVELLARAGVIVFDKTGTLTRGDPEVLEALPVGSRPINETLALAAAAEAHQRHPAAQALRRYAERRGIAVPDDWLQRERSRVAKGVVARVAGHAVVVGRRQLLREQNIDVTPAEPARARHRALRASSIYVAVDGRVEAAIAYADPPRPESAAVVAALRRSRGGRRREIVLMSGDAARTADAIGTRVGVDRVIAELLPEDKAKYVRAMQRSGRVVAMVGDGLNDAPALALADVGVSLRGGTDLAMETADVVLLEGGLAGLPRAFELAEQTMRRVRRGLAAIVVPNAVAIVLGALGWMPPGVAAAVNNGSTVIAAMLAVAPLMRARPTSERSEDAD